MKTGTLIAAAAASILLASGCGSSSSGSTSPSSKSTGSQPMSSTTPSAHSAMPKKPASAAMITIKSFAFHGPKGAIAPGTKVSVTNKDTETHSITADSGGAFNVNIPPGATKSFTAPTKPGSYPYHCNFHSSMHGTLKVK